MSEIWKNIIIAVITFFLTFIGQQYFFDKKNEIQKIDVRTSFDSTYLSKPKFPDSKVEITINNQTKNSIGLLEISLINFTRKDYYDIPFIFEITPKKNSSFSYLSHFAHGENGMKDLVSKTQDYEYKNGTYRFFYTAKSLNRTDKTQRHPRL